MASNPDSSIRRRTASHWGSYTAEVRDGRLVAVAPFAKDAHPSPMIEAMPEIVYHKTRIARPMVRSGWLKDRKDSDRGGRGAEPFVAVSWDEALDLVAGELRRIRDEHGNAAILGGSYGWSSAGRMHHARTLLHRFLHGFGGCTQQVQNYSYGAGMTILPYVLGSSDAVTGRVTSYASIAANTRLLVMFGGIPLKNTQIESGGIGDHATESWLRRIKAAGVEMVNISPVRDDVADFLDVEMLSPRPTTDAAIMLGLAHTLVAENLHDKAFLERYCAGFDRFLPYLMGETDGQPKDADWAARISELDAEAIRSLARRMAATRTMITVSWSIQRCDHGEQPYWMAAVLAAMLGQIGLPGGGVGYGYGSTGGIGLPRPPLASPKMPSGTNGTARFIPCARFVDALLSPDAPFDWNGRRYSYPDIRMVYWAGGNPFHHHQDLNRLLRAWQRPETIVVHEPWWTSTARHADIVLPATTTLERNDIAAGSRDRFLLAMERAIEPVGEARDDFRIFADLAARLGFRDAFTEGRDEMDWLRHLYDIVRQGNARHGAEMPDFDDFWRAGHLEFPESPEPCDYLSDFRADPEAHPLNTPSGRIEIYSESIARYGYDDCPAHPVWLEPAEWLGGSDAAQYPLHLVSNQPRHRLHGQLDVVGGSRDGKIAGREPIWIHPEDAEARGIRDGAVVRVFNGRGACLAGVVVTEMVRPRVVMMATGAWYDPLEPGVPGSLDRHGNANILTLDKGSSKLGQATIAETCLVEVELYEGEPPEITVFDPPPVV